MTQSHVAVIYGSLRNRSYTQLALEHALVGASTTGGTTELVSLREYDLPPLSADFDEQGGSAELVHAVDDADAVILGTPVYHGSYSGILKSTLDYCGFDEFGEKTVDLLAVAGRSFPVTALEHLRSVCRSPNSWVFPHQVTIPRISSSLDDDDLASEGLCERVGQLGRDAVVYANIEPKPPTLGSDENVDADD